MSIQGTKLFNALNHSLDREQNAIEEASQQRLRNAAENMTPSKSPNFILKSLEFQTKFDKAAGVHMVELKKVYQHHDQMQHIYDPIHPQADESVVESQSRKDVNS